MSDTMAAFLKGLKEYIETFESSYLGKLPVQEVPSKYFLYSKGGKVEPSSKNISTDGIEAIISRMRDMEGAQQDYRVEKDPDLLSLKDAVRACGRSTDTIRRWKREGLLTCDYSDDGRLFIDRESLIEAMNTMHRRSGRALR